MLGGTGATPYSGPPSFVHLITAGSFSLGCESLKCLVCVYSHCAPASVGGLLLQCSAFSLLCERPLKHLHTELEVLHY